MKEIKKKIVTGMVVIGLGLFCATTSFAGIKTTGSGASIAFDTTGFPPEMVANYKLMEAKCKKCHSLERAVVAVQTGLGPISGDIFDTDSTEAYGIKMMRMADAGMTKAEVRKIVALLNYMVELASE